MIACHSYFHLHVLLPQPLSSLLLGQLLLLLANTKLSHSLVPLLLLQLGLHEGRHLFASSVHSTETTFIPFGLRDLGLTSHNRVEMLKRFNRLKYSQKGLDFVTSQGMTHPLVLNTSKQLSRRPVPQNNYN